MNSDMRAKIISILENWRGVDGDNAFIADRILALFAEQPATAKLPEGVEIVKCQDGHFDVWTKDHTRVLSVNGQEWLCYNFFSDISGVFLTEADAITASLAAPPVPGESKQTLQESLRTQADYYKSRPESALHDDTAKTLDDARARIAELEAAYNELIMAVAQKFEGETRHQTALRYIVERESPTPAAKPDPRLFAPNGRAMVRYRYIPNIGMYGTNDEPHDTGGKWWWWNQTKQIWEATATDPLEGKPCTFDGTPITDTKPDPLARAVTVGDMMRLRDAYRKAGMPMAAQFIDAIFTPPQGAEHGQ